MKISSIVAGVAVIGGAIVTGWMVATKTSPCDLWNMYASAETDPVTDAVDDVVATANAATEAVVDADAPNI